MATTGIKQVLLTQQRLHGLLDYNPITGEFFWKVRRGGKANAGNVAGTRDSHGYTQILIDKHLYLAHRLAWFYVHGVWPNKIVDHRDNVISNNAFENLRLATDAESARNAPMRHNNTSGFKGVSWNKRENKWMAKICVNRRQFHLGYFNDPAEAHAAYCKAAVKHHGDFARAA